MDRINGTNTVDIGGGRRGFRDRNLVAGLPGTQVTAAHMTAQQEELMAVIEAAGLTPSAVNLAQLLEAIRRLAPGRLVMSVFSASGAFVVPAGVYRVKARVWGGGGGGGNSGTAPSGGGGGGGGGYAEGCFDVTPGATLPVTVGAAGAAGSGNGGTSSLGALLSATGGQGGTAGPNGGVGTGGAAGSGTGGQLNITPQGGSGGSIFGSQALAGSGGAAFGASGGVGTGSTAAQGLAPGGGGSGGANGFSGQAGGPGLVIVEY